MADRKEAITKHFTREQLKAMSWEELLAIIGEAGSDAKFHGKAVVRGPDGKIKYDDPDSVGSYDEL